MVSKGLSFKKALESIWSFMEEALMRKFLSIFLRMRPLGMVNVEGSSLGFVMELERRVFL